MISVGVRDLFHTGSERETREIARSIGERLTPGSIVLLQGELGAGKTVFVKGLAEALGINPQDVSSPTFTLIHEHRGRLPLFHVDLYRLPPAEVPDLGLEEVMTSGGIVAVEWPERLPEQMSDAVRVVITDRGGDERQISVAWPASPATPSGSSALPS